MSDPEQEQARWLTTLEREGRLSDKSKYVATVLSITLGYLGVDRLYLGHGLLGTLKLCTFGGAGIWWLLDIVLLASGAVRDGENRQLRP